MRRDNYGERNMAMKYPQYRVSQWIDTSEEAMNKPQATILYGVQIKPEKGKAWRHCYADTELLIFDTPEIAERKAADAVSA
jgi:hypothetical protein